MDTASRHLNLLSTNRVLLCFRARCMWHRFFHQCIALHMIALYVRTACTSFPLCARGACNMIPVRPLHACGAAEAEQFTQADLGRLDRWLPRLLLTGCQVVAENFSSNYLSPTERYLLVTGGVPKTSCPPCTRGITARGDACRRDS